MHLPVTVDMFRHTSLQVSRAYRPLCLLRWPSLLWRLASPVASSLLTSPAMAGRRGAVSQGMGVRRRTQEPAARPQPPL